MNKICINSRLIKVPDLNPIGNSNSICTIFFANYIWFASNKKTGFFKCRAWGILGKIIAEHSKTGTELFITRCLEQYMYETEIYDTIYNNYIVVEKFDFGSRATDSNQNK